MRIGGVLPPFVETVTDVEPDRRIAYRITKGGPLKDHRGELRFAPLDAGGTHLEWEISFGAKVPGLDVVVAKGLERSVRKGMQAVAREA
jgi:ribosome-associated toxin RatA of RatAB toxin-antitoxin module